MACEGRTRKGVTLIELMVTVAILAVIATLSFPMFQLMQQRDKENRLIRILEGVNSAIMGSGSYDNKHVFSGIYSEGYSNWIRRQIMDSKWDIDNNKLTPGDRKKALDVAMELGLFYPLTPSHLENPSMVQTALIPYNLHTGGPPYLKIRIRVDRRFFRKVAPHPFIGWYPGAHYEFEAAFYDDNDADSDFETGTHTYASESWPFPVISGPEYDPTADNPVIPRAVGVKQIWSRGAGFSIKGESTDSFPNTSM